MCPLLPQLSRGDVQSLNWPHERSGLHDLSRGPIQHRDGAHRRGLVLLVRTVRGIAGGRGGVLARRHCRRRQQQSSHCAWAVPGCVRVSVFELVCLTSQDYGVLASGPAPSMCVCMRVHRRCGDRVLHQGDQQSQRVHHCRCDAGHHLLTSPGLRHDSTGACSRWHARSLSFCVVGVRTHVWVACVGCPGLFQGCCALLVCLCLLTWCVFVCAACP